MSVHLVSLSNCSNCNSMQVYRNEIRSWTIRRFRRESLAKWMITLLIGCLVGLIAFVISEAIDLLADAKVRTSLPPETTCLSLSSRAHPVLSLPLLPCSRSSLCLSRNDALSPFFPRKENPDGVTHQPFMDSLIWHNI